MKDLKNNWKRWLSVVTAILSVVGFVFVGAADIFGIFELDQWGRLLGLIVQALCLYFGVDSGIKIKKGIE